MAEEELRLMNEWAMTAAEVLGIGEDILEMCLNTQKFKDPREMDGMKALLKWNKAGHGLNSTIMDTEYAIDFSEKRLMKNLSKQNGEMTHKNVKDLQQIVKP